MFAILFAGNGRLPGGCFQPDGDAAGADEEAGGSIKVIFL
jgi:hypothetical protein